MTKPTAPKLPPHPKTILFVCTGNICRSVLAEGIFRGMALNEGLAVRIHSAGTQTLSGKQASLQTLQLLLRDGVDLSHHRSRTLSREMVQEADIIFTMEQIHRTAVLKLAAEAKQKTFHLSQFYFRSEILPMGLAIPDPMGRDAFFYENVREIIWDSCQAALQALISKPVPVIV